MPVKNLVQFCIWMDPHVILWYNKLFYYLFLSLVSVCLYDSLCVLLVTLCDLWDYNNIHIKMLQRKVQDILFYYEMVLKLHPSVPLLNMVSISHM